MRVTQNMMYRQTLDALAGAQTRLTRQQDALSSGVSLRQAADDPAAMSQVTRNDDRLMQLERLDRNLQGLEGRYALIEHELDNVTDRLHRGRELMLSGANETNSAEIVSMLAEQLRGLGEDVQRYASARDSQGRYLFGGASDSVPPFEAGSSGSLYLGGSTAREIPVGEGFTLPDGLPGDAVFLSGPGGDLFALFDDLADILEAPKSAQRAAAIDEGLLRLDAALEGVLTHRAVLGGNMERVETEQARIADLGVDLAQRSSTLRDTDFAAAVSALSIELNALEAARKTFTQVQGLSLFNYLR